MIRETQEKRIETFNFQKPLEQYLLKDYINKGSMNYDLTANNIKDSLNLNFSEIDLNDSIKTIQSVISDTVSLQRELHYKPIREKAEKEGAGYGYSTINEPVDRLIKDFDFTKYENLSLNDLKTYLLDWDVDNQKVIKGDNLIEDINERTYVSVYRLLKLDEDFINSVVQAEEFMKNLDSNS